MCKYILMCMLSSPYHPWRKHFISFLTLSDCINENYIAQKHLRFLYSAPNNNSGFCWTNFTFEMRWLLYYRTKTLVLWDRLFLNELSQENKLLTHPEHEDPQDFYFHILKAQGNSACTWNKQNGKEGIKTLKYKLL